MKKQAYNIFKRNETGDGYEVKEVQGYIYTTSYGLVGVHGASGHWTATDLETGTMVGNGKTVVNAAVDAIENADRVKKAKPILLKAYKERGVNVLMLVGYDESKYTDVYTVLRPVWNMKEV